jgi:cadmium resistance protein CadD (predicted permease)
MEASPLATLGVGVALYVSTNIDDLVLLSVFFADRRLALRNVVVGQFAGIAALVAVSVVAALAALTIPQRWLAWLGLIPLLLGAYKLWELRGGETEDEVSELAEKRGKIADRRAPAQVLAVAGVTIANGGDNVAVYVPVFASDAGAIPAYSLIFGVLTAVWCAAGFALVNNTLIGDRVRRYGHILLPVVLIALGVWLLLDAWPATS